MMINRPKRSDEPPGEIPPPPLNPIQERVETIRAKTMACVHCDDDGWSFVYYRHKQLKPPRERCKICCDERALLEIIDELMEACEER